MQTVPNIPTTDAAVAKFVEVFIRNILRDKANIEMIERVVAALRPQLIGIPALNLNPEITKPDRGLSRKERVRRVEQDAAEFVQSIRDWVDEIISFFVEKLVQQELEKLMPEYAASEENGK